MFRTGRRLDGAHLQLLVAPAGGAVGCVGYVIAKKQLVRAVDRNYLRRMVREAVRKRRPGLNQVDIVVRLRRGCEAGHLSRLGLEAAELLDRVTGDSRQ
jgi:ribonuclease P protein component